VDRNAVVKALNEAGIKAAAKFQDLFR